MIKSGCPWSQRLYLFDIALKSHLIYNLIIFISLQFIFLRNPIVCPTEVLTFWIFQIVFLWCCLHAPLLLYFVHMTVTFRRLALIWVHILAWLLYRWCCVVPSYCGKCPGVSLFGDFSGHRSITWEVPFIVNCSIL